MRVWLRICLSLTWASVPAGAIAHTPEPTPSLKAGDFCAAVESEAIELESTHDSILYQYQSLAYAAAGVRPDDNDTVVASKVRLLLNREMPRLGCRPVNFVPQGGNILKLAVSRQADAFIDHVIRVWRIDLNLIDPVDNRTVLDYIQKKISDAGSNTHLARTYQRFYDRFRDAGAKHAAEVR